MPCLHRYLIGGAYCRSSMATSLQESLIRHIWLHSGWLPPLRVLPIYLIGYALFTVIRHGRKQGSICGTDIPGTREVVRVWHNSGMCRAAVGAGYMDDCPSGRRSTTEIVRLINFRGVRPSSSARTVGRGISRGPQQCLYIARAMLPFSRSIKIPRELDWSACSGLVLLCFEKCHIAGTSPALPVMSI